MRYLREEGALHHSCTCVGETRDAGRRLAKSVHCTANPPVATDDATAMRGQHNRGELYVPVWHGLNVESADRCRSRLCCCVCLLSAPLSSPLLTFLSSPSVPVRGDRHHQPAQVAGQGHDASIRTQQLQAASTAAATTRTGARTRRNQWNRYGERTTQRRAANREPTQQLAGQAEAHSLFSALLVPLCRQVDCSDDSGWQAEAESGSI